MKRRLGKLTLNRETLRNLQAGMLQRVQGGANTLEETSMCCFFGTGCDCWTETGRDTLIPCPMESYC